ncbi:hypothetical protein BLA24_28770 [Streptomyces cinnamoneus]|uniref:Uncharacterized protein n=1 Tax=Streptomyces cinnamoneus TaxID=53446 RepID=A0A2G1XBW6_STRCJ|nr:lysoplasmalogenase [Streptomyces cinnamoneus]PHQ48700.1 hypothetical protein BLA24_28770 [Streptomyces cinnamoneus]PPT12619.1 lysoplasmalogenase [Streptomyces cinnamoneus]
MRRSAASRAARAAFAVAAATHLTALAAGATVLALATKPLLMPLLAVHVLTRGGPRLLAVALLFGCGGDVLLQCGGDALFRAGMGSFAAGHVCYLVLFARHGSPGGARTHRLAAGYAAAWLGTVTLLWPDLDADLRLPVAGYSLLLTAMALGATRARLWTAAGGALFLLSDTLIATGLAGWPQAPVPQFWVMLTYLAAQCLLAYGVRRCDGESGGTGLQPPGPSSDRRPAGRTSRSRQFLTAARASTMPKP